MLVAIATTGRMTYSTVTLLPTLVLFELVLQCYAIPYTSAEMWQALPSESGGEKTVVTHCADGESPREFPLNIL